MIGTGLFLTGCLLAGVFACRGIFLPGYLTRLSASGYLKYVLGYMPRIHPSGLSFNSAALRRISFAESLASASPAGPLRRSPCPVLSGQQLLPLNGIRSLHIPPLIHGDCNTVVTVIQVLFLEKLSYVNQY